MSDWFPARCAGLSKAVCEMNPEVFLDQSNSRRIYTAGFPEARELYGRNRLFPVYAHIDKVGREELGLVMLLSYGAEIGKLNRPAQMLFRDRDAVEMMSHDFEVFDERVIAQRDVTGYIVNPGRDQFVGFSKPLPIHELLNMRRKYWKTLGR